MSRSSFLMGFATCAVILGGGLLASERVGAALKSSRAQQERASAYGQCKAVSGGRLPAVAACLVEREPGQWDWKGGYPDAYKYRRGKLYVAHSPWRACSAQKYSACVDSTEAESERLQAAFDGRDKWISDRNNAKAMAQ